MVHLHVGCGMIIRWNPTIIRTNLCIFCAMIIRSNPDPVVVHFHIGCGMIIRWNPTIIRWNRDPVVVYYYISSVRSAPRTTTSLTTLCCTCAVRVMRSGVGRSNKQKARQWREVAIFSTDSCLFQFCPQISPNRGFPAPISNFGARIFKQKQNFQTCWNLGGGGQFPLVRTPVADTRSLVVSRRHLIDWLKLFHKTVLWKCFTRMFRETVSWDCFVLLSLTLRAMVSACWLFQAEI